MSDHDHAPDPIDEAYLQAEAALGDVEARAARRARVLAAVALEAQAPAVAPPVARRLIWRPGGALAAAAVAGLSILLALHFRQASPFQPNVQPGAGEAVRSAPAKSATPPSTPASPTTPPAPAPSPEPAGRHESKPGDSNAPAAAADVAAIPPLPVPPAPVRVEEPAPPAAASRDIVVTAQRRAESLTEARVPAAEPPAASAFAGKTTAGSPADQAARLAAAAAAGRIGEVKALLAQGIPIDAADADGETALMKSIRAGQPAVAALLRERGASLDRENLAGESARDMAAAKDDSKLDKALGLAP